MLLRTCMILLLLSLLSVVSSVDGRATSVDGAQKLPARAVGSLPGQKRRAPARNPPGKAQGQGQGQGTQSRRPARRPARKRPSRRPQRRPGQQMNGNQITTTTANPRQTPMYLVCYLYPAGLPMYQDILPSQPFVSTGNGAMYPPYISYKISVPANAGNRASDDSVNKMFGPQPWYPSSPYPSRLVCPLYQVAGANGVTSPQPDWEPAYYNSNNMPDTDDPDTPVSDIDPGIFDFPYDEEIPLPYNNVYGPSGPTSLGMYPTSDYAISQSYGYPPQFPFRTN